MANVHTGWIEDLNKFKLERPPDWFLTGLTTYDAMLVLIPSRFKRQYLLCRRRQFTAGLGDVAMMDNKHPDTNMCYGYHVLPIAPLRWEKSKTDTGMFTQPNLDSLIETLKERDAWAVREQLGSKDEYAVADAWMQSEFDREKKADAALFDKFYHMGRDAWRSLTARVGARNKRASDYHGVAAKPRKEQRVILTDAQ